ncbi:MAG: acetyl-CoA acetyltransferase [Chloroflexota bacterium]|nr:acetyl-CoA acetyltransferase [Chloroflexota bacterium]
MESIKDKVAIVGMGCTKFGEHWDKSGVDLIVEAAAEAYKDAGVETKDIQAAWLGTEYTGITGRLATEALGFDYIPVTRVENACATGSDALRNAVYGVASGTYDIAIAIGVEKVKDTGYSGLPGAAIDGDSNVEPQATFPSMFAMAATKYFDRYGLSAEEGKRLLAKIATKNHHNGSMNPRAHFQREVTLDQAINAPMIAWPLGLFDCCGVSDGAAIAIVVPRALAKNFRPDPVYIKGMCVSTGGRRGQLSQKYDYTHFEETVRASRAAYAEAGITDPLKQLSLVELHDCFSITELITYEDLGLCPRGTAKEYIEGGMFSLDGELPVNPDGGLKCFGHPIGASGIRMMYEVYKQLQGKAQNPSRQLKKPELGLTHNLGGFPLYFICSCIIAGL